MSRIKDAIRSTVMQRPFDFYVAFLLFITGFYSIVSETWPETVTDGVGSVFLVIVSLYFMASSILIMMSLSCKRKKHPILSLVGEKYGWLFICAASITTTLMYLSSAIHTTPPEWWLWFVLVVVWAGMSVASAVRYLDLLYVYRSLKK